MLLPTSSLLINKEDNNWQGQASKGSIAFTKKRKVIAPPEDRFRVKQKESVGVYGLLVHSFQLLQPLQFPSTRPSSKHIMNNLGVFVYIHSYVCEAGSVLLMVSHPGYVEFRPNSPTRFGCTRCVYHV